MKKTTKTENFEAIKAILEDLGQEELAKVMGHEIELIANKKAKGKLTKTQEANEGIKGLILDIIKNSEKPLSITEMLNASSELAELTGNSNQKVSALVTQLKKAEIVERVQEGKKAVFKLKDTEVEDTEDTEVEGE